MLNIFLTYRCNLACDYCFASDLRREFDRDMRPEDFSKLSRWMAETGVASVGLLGGEPTLHPDLLSFAGDLQRIGITTVLFTNGLFSSEIARRLPDFIANYVVNCNEPGMYSPAQYSAFHTNIETLTTRGARITLSKNFSLAHQHYDHILDTAIRHGIKTVRYDIARPGTNRSNIYFAPRDGRTMMRHIVNFVRECEAIGIKTGMDCCVKYCELSPDERSFLERFSLKLTGICHPSIDIHPDLSASYCLPLREVSVPDVTTFSNRERLMHHFAATVRPWRFDNVGESCGTCDDFQKKCQGGCLAAKNSNACTMPGGTQANTLRNIS